LPTFFSTTTTTAIGISSCWSRVRRPYPPIVWKDRPTGTKRTQQNKTPHTHKQKTFQYSIKKIREFFPFFFFFHQIFRLFFFVFRRFKSRVAFALIGRTTREKERGGEPTERERSSDMPIQSRRFELYFSLKVYNAFRLSYGSSCNLPLSLAMTTPTSDLTSSSSSSSGLGSTCTTAESPTVCV
jgi:hypothetical protein